MQPFTISVTAYVTRGFSEGLFFIVIDCHDSSIAKERNGKRIEFLSENLGSSLKIRTPPHEKMAASHEKKSTPHEKMATLF